MFANNLLHGFRRFVELRSAWRRSLALEPLVKPLRCRRDDGARCAAERPGASGEGCVGPCQA